MATQTEMINLPVTHLDDVLERHSEPRWSEKLIRDGRNRAALICSPEGAPPDPHLHPDFNEWWVILGGEITYQVGEYEPFVARDGDIVIAPCGQRHDIRPTAGGRVLRLVVGPEHSNHDLKGVPPSRLLPFHEGLEPPNLIHTPMAWMLERHGVDKAWSEEVVLDDRNRANMIHNMPGETNRPHWHPDMDEWWVVLKGELTWKIGDREPVVARKGDLVFAGAGYLHEIKTIGNESSIRLAVTTPDVRHVFPDGTEATRPPKA
ncbi:MAG: cupin domain-containing protein [Dehalococcoidia bacterium]